MKYKKSIFDKKEVKKEKEVEKEEIQIKMIMRRK